MHTDRTQLMNQQRPPPNHPTNTRLNNGRFCPVWSLQNSATNTNPPQQVSRCFLPEMPHRIQPGWKSRLPLFNSVLFIMCKRSVALLMYLLLDSPVLQLLLLLVSAAEQVWKSPQRASWIAWTMASCCASWLRRCRRSSGRITGGRRSPTAR